MIEIYWIMFSRQILNHVLHLLLADDQGNKVNLGRGRGPRLDKQGTPSNVVLFAVDAYVSFLMMVFTFRKYE